MSEASEQNISPESREELQQLQAALEDYRGFFSVEDRQASEKAICGYLNAMLDDFYQQVQSLSAFLNVRKMNALHNKAGQVSHRIEMLADKVQSAPYAYSAFFTADYVPDDIQEGIIHADFETIQTANEIEKILQQTLKYQDAFDTIVERIDHLTDSLDKNLENRITAIMVFG